MKNWLLLLVLALLMGAADARLPRSVAAKREFQRIEACPSTGRHRGPCPGWEIDHRVPLKCGGADRPENMQWLSRADHKAKTKREAKWCRKGKGPEGPSRNLSQPDPSPADRSTT